MKTRSAKAKGRRLAVCVKEKLVELLGFSEGDVFVRTSGDTGTDLFFSQNLTENFPFDIECKNQEKLNIWSAIAQAEKNSKPGRVPLVCFSRNHSGVYVALALDDFLRVCKREIS